MLEKISRYILAVCMSVALLNWVLQFSAESMMAKKKLFAAAYFGWLMFGALSLEAATGTSTWTASDTTGVWSSTSITTDWKSATIPNAAGWLAEGPTASGGSGTVTLDINATVGWLKPGGNSGGCNWTVNGTTKTITMDGTGLGANAFAHNNVACISMNSSINTMTVQPSLLMSNTDLDIGAAYNATSTSTTLVGVLGTTTINNAGSTGNSAAPHNLTIQGAEKNTAVTINSSIGTSGAGIVISNIVSSGSAVLAGALGSSVTSLTHNSPGTLTVSGNYTGTGGVTVQQGTLILSGPANAYSGNTIVAAGIIQLGAANAIPSGSSVNVGGTLNLAGFTDTIGGLSGGGTVDGTSGSPTLTVGGNNSGGTFSGVIKNTAGTLSLVKTGAGAETLSGTNTYSGNTTISNGTLLVNGLLGGGAVTNKGGTLGGSGAISCPVTVQSGAFLQPGLGGVDTSTLTINNNLTLAGNAVFTLNRTNAQNASRVSGVGTLTLGGILTVTNAGPALEGGDLFFLFNATAQAGSFSATNLPALTAGLFWTNTLSINGAISVISTLPPTNAVITNLPAANISATSATLNGKVLSTGGQSPAVTLYYGVTDGGTNAASWRSSVSLGAQAGNFSCVVTGLLASTTYYYSAKALNNAGAAWAAPSQSFTTPAAILATVTNLPASNVQGASAILNGQILSIGNQTPTVTLYYGPADGGANAAAWTNNIYLGQQSGSFAVTVTGLSTNTIYYFTAAAENKDGMAWAAPSLTFTTLPTAPVVSVLTYHNDNARTGANTNETLLTPGTVNTNNFGRLITYAVDGFVFAQPLYAANLAIPGQGTRNVVFVATEHDSIYAFDADNNAGANGGLLWHTNLGIAPLSNNGEFGGRYHNGVYTDLTPEVGITGTPVIDPVSSTLYADVLTREVTITTTNYYHRIHALNITNGMEQPYSPVVVSGSVPGQSVGGNGLVVSFDPKQEAQRPALTLAGGILYVAYGSFADTDPYHGWVMGFNATNLVQLTNYIFNTTPNATTSVFGANAGEGALWMGGDGLCVDANTNLYFETANGSFSENTGGGDYGDSFVKLATTNQLLAVADYFTPTNQAAMQAADSDLGSGGPMLLPDSVGSTAHPHLLVGGGKAGIIFLVDRDNMGTYASLFSPDRVVQKVFTGMNFFSTPAYFNYTIYYQGRGTVMNAYTITNGFITPTAVSSSGTSFAGFGTTPLISANGSKNGIVWAIQTDGASPSDTGAGVLHAYNATNLSLELYNSSQNSTRDNPGPGVKYSVPTVANGKVYVGAQYALSVFGYTAFLATPGISPAGAAFTNSVVVTLADATPGCAIYYTLDGTLPTTNSILYSGPFAVVNTLNLQAVAVKSGAVNSGVASASFINTAAVGNGTGLTGQYWTNTTSVAFTNFTFAIPPTLTRTDAVVNFNWNSAGPDPRIGRTNFTARWTGSLQPQYSETYTFTTIADDGVRLWVNGQLLVDDWAAQSSAATNNNSITLNAQQLYNLRLDYFQNSSNAVAQLLWSSPSTAQAIIPQTQLYPFTNPPPTIVLSGPADNSAYTATASVSLGANADAPYNPISTVAFYANGNWLGTLSNSPDAPLYALTATGLGTGNYALTAVATDGSGLSSTSAPVNINVATGSGLPYGLTGNGPVPAFLNMPQTYNGALPPLLSETGAFSDTTNRISAGGLIPYAPNVPLWKDNAVSSWLMALPENGGLITPGGQIQFQPTNSWTFPAGSVFVKNFDLVVNETNSSIPPRRLETQLLVRDVNGSVYGVTYKWRPDNSDADLLAGSLSEDILITNVTGVRTQTWYYPSPSDCQECHNTPVAGNSSGINVLGVNARQLNGNLTYSATGVTDNQLRTLNRLGLFFPAINEAAIGNYAQLAPMTNVSASLQERVRSYLDANCEQCHQPGGQGITWDARHDTPLAQQNITNYPASFPIGISDNACVVKSQDIWRSTLLLRINTLDQDIQMPDFRNLIDTNAVQVITDWINRLPGTPALAPPAITPNGGSYVGSVNVLLSAPDTNAAIYYTLDGSLPTTNSARYAGPFNLFTNQTVSASASETNFNPSVAASAIFNVQPMYFTSANFPAGGPFQMGFVGVTGGNYVLQASTNFSTWTPISTNTAVTNVFNLLDPAATNFPYRFYRVLQQ